MIASGSAANRTTSKLLFYASLCASVSDTGEEGVNPLLTTGAEGGVSFVEVKSFIKIKFKLIDKIDFSDISDNETYEGKKRKVRHFFIKTYTCSNFSVKRSIRCTAVKF